MRLLSFIPHAVVLLGGACIFEAAIGGAVSPPLAPRLELIRAAPCDASDDCRRLALQLGLDPVYALMPDDALTHACTRGDDTACAYLLPCNW